MSEYTDSGCRIKFPHATHGFIREGSDWICEGIDDVEKKTLIPGMGPDQPTVTNAEGAGQSDIPYRFDLIDGPAMFKMAQVLDHGARKYGANNWRKIPIEDHLNHLIAHAYAYLSGDISDDHLSHILCRAMFAQGVERATLTDD